MKKFDHKVPFNDLPLLPPKADIENKQILRKTIRAGRALAQLNGTLLNLPNPTLFLDTIYLQEAKAFVIKSCVNIFPETSHVL